MAVIVSLTTVGTGFLNKTATNANYAAIETGFVECLSRTSTSNNAMQVPLDMGSNSIINAGHISITGITLNGTNFTVALQDYVDAAGVHAANALASANAASASAAAADSSATASANSAAAAAASEAAAQASADSIAASAAQIATNASNITGLQSSKWDVPANASTLLAINQGLSTTGNPTFTSVSEAGVTLSAKYGRLASANTWIAAQTFTQPLTVSVAGTSGVVTVATIGANGNGGTGRGTKIVLTAPGSTNAVSVAEVTSYQETVSATPTAATLALSTSNSSGTMVERLRIPNTGKVLIGTTTDNGVDILQLNQGATTGGIRVAADAGVNPAISFTRGGTAVATYTGSFDGMQLNGSQAIRFDIGGTEIARFTTAGLTIGQTTQTAGNLLALRSANPYQARFQGTAASAGLLLEDTAVADGSRPFVYFQDVAGRLNLGNANRSAGNITSSATWFSITTTGQLATGNEASPDCDPGGLTLQHGTGSSFVLTFKSTSVSHPFTTINNANTYGAFLKNNGSEGGMQIRGATSGTAPSFRMLGLCVTPLTSDTSTGVFSFDARKHNGSGGSTGMGATDVIASFESIASPVVTIRGNGLIYTAAGIKLSASSSTLSNYTEGTWTPVLAGATTAGTMVASTQIGTYTRIGRVVYCQFNLVLTSFSGQAGNLIMTGLPFTTGSHGVVGPGPLLISRFIGIPYSGTLVARTGSATTSIDFWSYEDAGTTVAINSTAVSGTASIQGAIIYHV